MAREISAGGVVLRWAEGRWWVAAIEPQFPAEKRARHSKPVTALPKGMVDRGERPEEAALREVSEETGVKADLVSKLTDIRYVYVRAWGDGARVFKVVSFYLLLYRSGKLGKISPDMRIEVRGAMWIPLEEAPQRLTYRGEQDVARLALEYVAAHPDLPQGRLDPSPSDARKRQPVRHRPDPAAKEKT
jgi:8-oxo-dGTP pyrophosphatase MutT (NUDIX family)